MYVKQVLSSRTVWKHLFPIPKGALPSVCHKSTHSSLPDDYSCQVGLALTSVKGQQCATTLLWTSRTNTRNLSLNLNLGITMKDYTNKRGKPNSEKKSDQLEQGPMIEQVSKVFATTEHHWPRHKRHKKLNPSRERYCSRCCEHQGNVAS